jgi:hypothetical protein
LVPEDKRFIFLSSIQTIKVGHGKFENHLFIMSETKELMIKIEDPELLSRVMEGLILFCDEQRKKDASRNYL